MTCHDLIGNRIRFRRTWSMWIGISQIEFNNEQISSKPGGSFALVLITRGREEHCYKQRIVPPWEGFPLWTSLCTLNVRRQMQLTAFQAAANVSLFHNKPTLFFCWQESLASFLLENSRIKVLGGKKYVCLERTAWFTRLVLNICLSVLVKAIIKCWKVRHQTVR